MGKYEREAVSKLFSGKQITKTRFTLLDVMLYPYRAFKNWSKRRLIKKEFMRHIRWATKKYCNEETPKN